MIFDSSLNAGDYNRRLPEIVFAGSALRKLEVSAMEKLIDYVC